MQCIVCKKIIFKFYKLIDKKKYWRCKFCHSIFLDKKNYLDKDMEKKHYLKHENYIENQGYRNFLAKLYNPLVSIISKKDEGLDFGCGYSPVLAEILKIKGFKVDLYDPFFFPNNNIFLNKYDFITCTETIEHFFNPCKEFDLLDKLLKKGGLLAIMTSFLSNDIVFDNWYYRRDPSHVVFYEEKTLKIIAKSKGWTPEVKCKNVIFFKKSV